MKTDEQLGLQVKQFLIDKGVETPMVDNGLTDSEKIAEIKDKFTDIMNALGLDLQDDSLIDTPNRVAKMYVKEIFFGLDYKHFLHFSLSAKPSFRNLWCNQKFCFTVYPIY